MSIEHARARRAEKAAVLAALESGERSLRGTLRSPPDAIGTCYVFVVLMSCPGMGRERTTRVLRDAGVWPIIQFGSLRWRERAAINRALPDHVH